MVAFWLLRCKKKSGLATFHPPWLLFKDAMILAFVRGPFRRVSARRPSGLHQRSGLSQRSLLLKSPRITRLWTMKLVTVAADILPKLPQYTQTLRRCGPFVHTANGLTVISSVQRMEGQKSRKVMGYSRVSVELVLPRPVRVKAAIPIQELQRDDRSGKTPMRDSLQFHHPQIIPGPNLAISRLKAKGLPHFLDHQTSALQNGLLQANCVLDAPINIPCNKFA